MSDQPQGLRLEGASIRIDSMPVTGRDVAVSPSAEERAAIAAQLGITAVDRLDVALHAVKFRGGTRVTGRLAGAITQPSVVSLEAVHQDIAEPIDRIFLPAGEKPQAAAAGAEVFVDLDGEDVPDHFEGTEADLSHLIIETLALAIDPYPRAPGEALEVTGDASDPAEDSPFAALKALKPEKG